METAVRTHQYEIGSPKIYLGMAATALILPCSQEVCIVPPATVLAKAALSPKDIARQTDFGPLNQLLADTHQHEPENSELDALELFFFFFSPPKG